MQSTEETPVVEVVAIEETINTELQKANITDQIIAGLKEKYGKLTIAGQDDKTGYEAVKNGRKECKSWRVMAQKICKKGREDAVAIQKAWVAKEKEVTEKISEVEDYLEAQEKEYEAEKERIKLEQKQRQDKIFAARMAELVGMGATFTGTDFVLQEVSCTAATVRDSEDDVYAEVILPKFKTIFVEIELQKEKERAKKEEEERLLNAERQRLEEEKRKIEEEKEKMERERKEHEEKLAEAEKKRLEELVRHRALQLSEIGLKYDGKNYIFGTTTVPEDKLLTDTNENWEELIVALRKVVEFEKAEIDRKEQERIEAEKAEAAAKAAREEREKFEREQREKEQARIAEEEKKREELERASDKEKWAAFIEQLEKVQFPTVTGKYFKQKAKVAEEKIKEIIEL